MEPHDPLDLDSQDEAKEARELRARAESKTEADDFMWLMSSRRGRRIVWCQLQRAGVFRLSFATDHATMSFAEGNRNEGLFIWNQIHALCPERYPEMAKEAKEK